MHVAHTVMPNKSLRDMVTYCYCIKYILIHAFHQGWPRKSYAGATFYLEIILGPLNIKKEANVVCTSGITQNMYAQNDIYLLTQPDKKMHEVVIMINSVTSMEM